jgi:hypothetical protein
MHWPHALTTQGQEPPQQRPQSVPSWQRCSPHSWELPLVGAYLQHRESTSVLMLLMLLMLLLLLMLLMLLLLLLLLLMLPRSPLTSYLPAVWLERLTAERVLCQGLTR